MVALFSRETWIRHAMYRVRRKSLTILKAGMKAKPRKKFQNQDKFCFFSSSSSSYAHPGPSMGTVCFLVFFLLMRRIVHRETFQKSYTKEKKSDTVWCDSLTQTWLKDLFKKLKHFSICCLVIFGATAMRTRETPIRLLQVLGFQMKTWPIKTVSEQGKVFDETKNEEGKGTEVGGRWAWGLIADDI